MATIIEMLRRELDAAAAEGRQPVSWELSAEALAALRTVDDKTIASADEGTVLDLPVAESDVPGFSILLVTNPT